MIYLYQQQEIGTSAISNFGLYESLEKLSCCFLETIVILYCTFYVFLRTTIMKSPGFSASVATVAREDK